METVSAYRRVKLPRWMTLVLSWLVLTSLNGRVFAADANTVVTVFAASSTAEVLTTLARGFEAKNQVRVRFSFAASSVLARQIEQNAPCDFFVSADQKWMDYLADKHLIQVASRRDVAGNHLVVVMPAGKVVAVIMEKGFDFAGTFGGRLALGDPDYVPAGTYARAALREMGWWTSVTNRLAPAENVRAALRLVELGEAEAGIVYLSDAKLSGKVAVAGQFPESATGPIRYRAALCGRASPGAKAFLDYVAGKEAAGVWTAAGFTSLVK